MSIEERAKESGALVQVTVDYEDGGLFVKQMLDEKEQAYAYSEKAYKRNILLSNNGLT